MAALACLDGLACTIGPGIVGARELDNAFATRAATLGADHLCDAWNSYRSNAILD